MTKMIRQRRLTGGGLTVSHWIVEGVTLAQSLLASLRALLRSIVSFYGTLHAQAWRMP
jgi:hypothetical protein